jgi:hypothetical protein
MSDDKITYGQFVTRKVTGPATVTDCSGWGVAPAEVVEVSARPEGGELHLHGLSPTGDVESGEVISEQKRKASEALAALRAAVDAAHAAGIRFVLRKPE